MINGNADKISAGRRVMVSARFLIAIGLAWCVGANAQPLARWWKGNLHTHTLWSDGDDFPEMVVDWYKTRGYDFLALSDHNVLMEGPMWLIATNQTQARRAL